MNSERLFRTLSYITVLCGFAALWMAGALGMTATFLFLAATVAAWTIEGTRRQISERLGTLLVVLAVPLHYVLWKFGLLGASNLETVLPGVLARLILALTAIKLLQRKSDRDWIFLYVMSFFQVLLAAGLSISPTYLVVLIAYAFFILSTIIVFEMRKTRESIFSRRSGRLPVEPTILEAPVWRVPRVAFVMMFAIALVALPIFFLIPRVGGAGFGMGSSEGVSARSGFSDTVRLGAIGRIQQNDEIVMRVRLEGNDSSGNLKWRGIALDTFDGRSWTRSRPNTREPRSKGEREIIQVDYATGRESLLLQTIYLEPLDVPVLFSAPRAVGVQGNFNAVFKDAYGGVYFQRSGERTSYRVLSDTSLPSDAELRADRAPNPSQFGSYLQLPEVVDPRIGKLSEQLTASARNRLDAARSIEQHLQTAFGYTLEQKAGGEDPVADFLFNVREGHCEYFATSMALMLRTLGIATRVVTGFQQGEYNEAADVFVVRQRHAHAWVEVYFPAEQAWVPFDPTPAGGQNLGGEAAGYGSTVTKYLEALETFWIQYFVAFDNQEQRSLFTSLRRGLSEYQNVGANYSESILGLIAEWWKDARGDNGLETMASALGYGAAAIITLFLLTIGMIWLIRKLGKLGLWRRLHGRFSARSSPTIVEFYDQMIRVLSDRGLVREPYQTPLEFAHVTGLPDAVSLTERYNRVRFGGRPLTGQEATEVRQWLARLADKG